ncbi:hypothetical protein [Kitasatospora sp. NPDC088346]|uniref:hypothetical protein n=1 Tax=Kitasatospora sp. NPDC088346 TaxID=3364073 RepID=UPI0038225DB3
MTEPNFPDDLIDLQREYNSARRAMWAEAMEDLETRRVQLEIRAKITEHHYWTSIPEESLHAAYSALKRASLQLAPEAGPQDSDRHSVIPE